MRELSQNLRWIRRNLVGFTETVARNSLQIMNLCKDEKSNLNYYSAGSLNQCRAENDCGRSLIFNWKKSTWWQVQRCFTAGRPASPWLFRFQRSMMWVCQLQNRSSLQVTDRAAWLLACASHRNTLEDNCLRTAHSVTLGAFLTWPVVCSAEADWKQVRCLEPHPKLHSSPMPSQEPTQQPPSRQALRGCFISALGGPLFRMRG